MRGRQTDLTDGAAITIDRRYVVLPDMACGEFAGLPAFVVDQRKQSSDRGGDRVQRPLIAVKTRRDAPPPANFPLFLNAYSTSLLMPVAHGAGAGDYWIICDAPNGPALCDTIPGTPIPTEGELAATYLRPLALALGRLQTLGLTHRGVRPANLFRSTESGRILLGPGCLMPPAFAQPVLYEPPSVGICAPEARGAGTSSDDIYALGVLLLELALGRPPLREFDAEQIVRRKLELGSFNALTAGERLPPVLVSLLRSMLCDEPEGRPTLAALAETGVGAERPKAPRPEARAPRPLMVGRVPVWTARTLAFAFTIQSKEALALLRAGVIDQWLRRALEQPLMAARLEEALHGNRDRNDDAVEHMILMQTVALLDPLAPLFWAGQWFWPDGVPAMLAMQMLSGGDDVLSSAMRQGVLRRWGQLTGRTTRMGIDELERRAARAARLPVPALRPSVLAYNLNPFLACTSPALGGACVLHAAQLVAALEAMTSAQVAGASRLLDSQMLALLAARSEAGAGTKELTVPADADERLLDLQALAQAQLQGRRPVANGGEASAPALLTLPRLAARLLPVARERLNGWPGKGRRLRRMEQLEKATAAGDLVAMIELSCRDDAWAADDKALQDVRAQADLLRTAHRASSDAAPHRARQARAAGREVAVVGGIVALLGAVTIGFVF